MTTKLLKGAAEPYRNPELFPRALGAACGGLLGGLLGHALAFLALRSGDTAGWLKGPYGPPFFSLLLTTAIFYACLGAGLFRGRRRLTGAAVGLAVPCVVLGMPLAAATRVSQDLPWVGLILGLYTASALIALLLLGALSRGGWSWRAAMGSLAGGAAAYVLGLGLSLLFPALAGGIPSGLLPPVGALLQAGFSGLCVGTGAALAFQDPGSVV